MRTPTQIYLQKAWSDPLDNVSINDVKTAIHEIKDMDEEHGAFWVGVIYEDENILETHKDLSVMAVFSDEPEVQFRKQADNWTQIEDLYSMFLKGELEALKTALED
ncbi:hypothetical protein GZH53_09955 [Flavihumibacter sp. R14]|nr:hypothetical protein [Flavihumibacter soli]